MHQAEFWLGFWHVLCRGPPWAYMGLKILRGKTPDLYGRDKIGMGMRRTGASGNAYYREPQKTMGAAYTAPVCVT